MFVMWQIITSGSLSKSFLNHPGCTYLDIITPSDVAYIISMIKNSAHLWLLNRGDARKEMELDNVTLKSVFTAGQKKKRMFGVTTWNKLGIDYYTNAHEKWKDAFTKTDPQYII